MVSWIARPAVTTPPGELMYMKMSFFGFSNSRKSSWAVISEAIWSSIGAGDEDDPLAQQPRIDVEAALAPVGLLDDDRNEAGDDVLMVDHVNGILLCCGRPTSGGSAECSSRARVSDRARAARDRRAGAFRGGRG